MLFPIGWQSFRKKFSQKNNPRYAGAKSLRKSIRGNAATCTTFTTVLSLPFFGGVSTEFRQYNANFKIFSTD